MGDYAASGGYYISCNADSIFALPNTITGSIGVFGVMMNTQKMFNNKLGITFDTEKTSALADLGDGNKPMTERERAIIQSGVDTIYHLFKSHVAEGRKMDINYVDSIGQGRVWTGKRALDLKLVDGLGGLDRAIAAAAKLAGLSSYRVMTYPKPTSDMERLLKLMNNQAQTELASRAFLQSELGSPVINAWTQLSLMLKHPKTIWTILPFIPETN